MSNWDRFYKIAPLKTRILVVEKGDRTVTHAVSVSKANKKIHLSILHRIKCPGFYESTSSEFMIESYEEVLKMKKELVSIKFKYDDTFPKVATSLWIQSL